MPRISQKISIQRLQPARACTLLGLALLALSGPAWAQQSAPPAALDATQPAATAHTARLAEERFAEGTTLFKQWRFEEAEQRFREALAHQDHPLIHLYLSRALEKQGRLVEAHEALQPALRPGVEPPLPSEDVHVAESLRQSLESRLAQLEVSCDVAGAEVFLDGEPWFTAPARVRRMISAGQHLLVARKPGYFPVAEPVSLFPGKQIRVVLRITRDVIQIGPRWQPWQLWSVAGTGIAASLAGGLLLWQARTDYAALQPCAEASCDSFSTRRLDRGEWKERIGTGALFVGGSALAASLAGLLLDRPRFRRSEMLDITPMLSGESTGISVQIKF